MGDIYIPHSLNNADATLRIADALQKLTDQKERQKIADDIKAHHALNDTEAKKAEEARALIKQNQDILSETKAIEARNKIIGEEMEKAKRDFDVYCESERRKISDKWSDVNLAAQTAKELHTKAEGMINNVAGREEALRKEKEAHVDNIKQLSEDAKALDEKRKSIEKFQQDVMALDTQTKQKVEKLKQFNF